MINIIIWFIKKITYDAVVGVSNINDKHRKQSKERFT